MKVIILNASPRKNWNTAQLLKSAQKGAESTGAECEYVNLYDLNFTGCRSCLACKRRGAEEPCRCYWKDELAPLIERIYQADRLILGSPVYYGEPSGVLRQALERICFPAMSYNDYTSYLKGKVDVDIFLTMNVGEEMYVQSYDQRMKEYFAPLHFLNGEIRIHPVYDTLQIGDYSKFELGSFSEEHKKARHESQFPVDLDNAFKVGANE